MIASAIIVTIVVVAVIATVVKGRKIVKVKMESQEAKMESQEAAVQEKEVYNNYEKLAKTY